MASDRCTYWLYSYDERMARAAARRRTYERAEFLALAELVTEVVHPGNLGFLPPSPDMLRYKARQIGLIGG